MNTYVRADGSIDVELVLLVLVAGCTHPAWVWSESGDVVGDIEIGRA